MTAGTLLPTCTVRATTALWSCSAEEGVRAKRVLIHHEEMPFLLGWSVGENVRLGYASPRNVPQVLRRSSRSWSL